MAELQPSSVQVSYRYLLGVLPQSCSGRLQSGFFQLLALQWAQGWALTRVLRSFRVESIAQLGNDAWNPTGCWDAKPALPSQHLWGVPVLPMVNPKSTEGAASAGVGEGDDPCPGECGDTWQAALLICFFNIILHQVHLKQFATAIFFWLGFETQTKLSF